MCSGEYETVVASQGAETSPSPTGVVDGYVVPAGYVLVEAKMYQLLLSAFHGQGKVKKTVAEEEIEEGGKFKLRMLRQYMIGDINQNLQPGDQVEFVPGAYLKIGGEKHKKTQSFLSVFRMQYGPQPHSSTVRDPIFELLNPDEAPDPSSVFGFKGIPPARRWNSEQARIDFEENRGDSARRKTKLSSENDESSMHLTTTPQATMQQVAELDSSREHGHMSDKARRIHGMQADQIERPQGSNVGSSEYQEPQSVQDFEVSSRQAGGGMTVAVIGGKPADEGKQVVQQRQARTRR